MRWPERSLMAVGNYREVGARPSGGDLVKDRAFRRAELQRGDGDNMERSRDEK